MGRHRFIRARRMAFAVCTVAWATAAVRGGETTVLLDTTNGAAVRGNPAGAATFRVQGSALIKRITNYHWNGGKGAKPGLIGLRHEESGEQVGAWQATGSAGQGGVKNAFWTVEPDFTLGAGTYRVVDGDVLTWSSNDESGDRGFTHVEAIVPAPEPPEPPDSGPVEAGSSDAAKHLVALQSQRVFIEAMRLRLTASRSLDDAIATCPVGRCLDFLRDSDEGREVPEAWPMLFSGSFVLVGQAGTPRPIVAFYNPWLDAALLTRWACPDGEPLMEAASLWIASDFPRAATEGLEPAQARWLHDSRITPAPDALKQRFDAFVQAFDEAYPVSGGKPANIIPAGGREAAVPFVAGQARFALSQVVGIQNPSSELHRPDLRRFLTALRRPDVRALEAMLPEQPAGLLEMLLNLPPDLRRSLVPIYALARPGGTAIVFLGVPAMPRFYVQVVLPEATDGRLTAVSVHDFSPAKEEGQ